MHTLVSIKLLYDKCKHRDYSTRYATSHITANIFDYEKEVWITRYHFLAKKARKLNTWCAVPSISTAPLCKVAKRNRGY